jgi:hypothetical protein
LTETADGSVRRRRAAEDSPIEPPATSHVLGRISLSGGDFRHRKSRANEESGIGRQTVYAYDIDVVQLDLATLFAAGLHGQHLGVAR